MIFDRFADHKQLIYWDLLTLIFHRILNVILLIFCCCNFYYIGDFNFNRRSEQDTFVLSNIAPQHPNFNRGMDQVVYIRIDVFKMSDFYKGLSPLKLFLAVEFFWGLGLEVCFLVKRELFHKHCIRLLLLFTKAAKNGHCVKSVQIRSFLWSVFSRIRTKYGEIFRISP